MISITNNAKVPDDTNFIVYSPDGDYADTELILCAKEDSPAIPSAQLQAQYIKYGPVVYQFNTPEELGAAIFAIDPESTHDAVLLYKEEEARKAARLSGTLQPGDPVPAPDSVIAEEAPVPEEEEADVKFFKEEAEQAANEASSTPEVAGTSTPEMPVIDVTEPPVIDVPSEIVPTPEVAGAASSTPEIPPELPVVETPAIDLSTTTPE